MKKNINIKKIKKWYIYVNFDGILMKFKFDFESKIVRELLIMSRAEGLSLSQKKGKRLSLSNDATY